MLNCDFDIDSRTILTTTGLMIGACVGRVLKYGNLRPIHGDVCLFPALHGRRLREKYVHTVQSVLVPTYTRNTTYTNTHITFTHTYTHAHKNAYTLTHIPFYCSFAYTCTHVTTFLKQSSCMHQTSVFTGTILTSF
jgi:hypothetical protein